MLNQFWTGLGGRLADRWATLLLSPVLVFCVAGIIATNWSRITSDGWQPTLKHWAETLQQLPVAAQGFLLLAGFTALSLAVSAVQRLTLPILRLLAGYWPPWLDWLYRPLLHLRQGVIKKDRERLRKLAGQEILTTRERRTYLKVNRRYLFVPADPKRQTPTRLGNILAAFEYRPLVRYGLNTSVCWSRLWLLLPSGAKEDVADARARLSLAIQVWIWGILFTGWVIYAWWALPIGLLVATVAYFRAVAAAATYGELFAACFDVHRELLYRALRLPFPAAPAQEQTRGAQLTKYLQDGSNAADVRFTG